MDYTIETAFCEDSTRQFLFNIEDRISNFLNKPNDDELTFEAMNSYQRMLVHLIVSHYQMASRSLEEKGNKDTNQEENKSSDQLKSVQIQKKKESKSPLLKLRDYLTKHQQQKHDSMMKGGGIFRNSSNKEQIKNEEDVVVFKGRGKARWKPEDYGNYRRENEVSTSSLKKEKECIEVEKEPKKIEEPVNTQNKIEEKEIKEIEQKSSNSDENANNNNGNKEGKDGVKEENGNKQTRMKMLQRINGILGANQNTRKQGDSHNQDGLMRIKEGEKIEKEPERDSKKITSTVSDGKAKENYKKSDNFLPSVNHILIIYEVIEGLEKTQIEDIFLKDFHMKVLARLQNSHRGVLVFESEREAERVLQSNKTEGFKVAKVGPDDKHKFSEIFEREYFHVANLRPKANKSAAIRMINGHLKIK